MRIIKVELDKLDKTVLNIGWEGEQNHVQVQIQCGAFFAKYPNAGAGLTVLSPANVTYPVVLDKEGNDLIWDIDASDVVNAGSGKIQLTFTDGTGDDAEVIKTVIGSFNVNASLAVDGTAPDPIQHWIDQAEQTARQIAEESAIYAKEEIVESYGSIAPAIIETASGEIASFSDGADGMLVKTLEVDIAPVQDLHGQNSPYPAGGSPQRWDEEWESGSINPSTGANANDNTRIRSKNYIPVLPSTVYYCKSSKDLALRYYGSDKSFIGTGSARNSTVTTPENCYYMRFAVVDTTSYGNDISINYPATETAYYSYSNICPISGLDSANVSRTGVNVWDEEWERGTVDWSTRKISPDAQGARICSKNFIPVISGETYYIYYQHYGNAVFGYADKTSNGIDISVPDATKLCTIPSGIRFIKFAASISNYGSDTYQNDISINYPSTDTQYNAYSGSTAEYEFPQEAGTVYGGTLTIHQDGTGELVVKRWYKKTTWGEGGQATSPTDGFIRKRYEMGISNKYPSTIPQICNVAPYAAAFNQFYLHFYVNDDSNAFVFLPENTPSDLEIEISGELAIPVTYQLTNQQVIALLKGNNVVFADCGSVSIEYPADTKLYIDGKVAELQALILENISNS